MTTFVQTEVRASEVARGCERMSVGRATGWEPEEPTGEAKEWFARGHLFEWYVGKQLDAKHGRENIIRQPEFQHPLGKGHSDFLIVPERLLVEVKSTQAGTLTTPVFENGVTQLKIGVRYHPDADRGALYMINPSTLRPADIFNVALTDADIADIDATFARIAAHIDARTLPDRVCTKPGQARGRMCPFAATCFADWEAPEPGEVTDPAALELASRIVALKNDERTHKLAYEAIEAARKEAQAELAEYVDEGESTVGPFNVKRWHVNGKQSFQVKAAVAAGISMELLAPFITIGNGHERIEITTAETAGDIDYGSEAPF